VADIEEAVNTDTRSEGSSEQIACPWCGAIMCDLWDHDWTNLEDIVTECDYCEKPFMLSRVVSVDYTAQRLVKP
jgi:hypothetical protein